MSGVRIGIVAGDTAGNSRRAATHYGRRNIEGTFPSVHAMSHGLSVLEFTFAFDDLPVHDLDALALRIPAGAIIKSHQIKVLEAAAGTTLVYDFGLVKAVDGVVIDVDGLDAAVAQATLADNAVIAGDGALVGAEVGADDAQYSVTLKSGSAPTAGRYQVKIEYEAELQRQDPANGN